MTWALPGCREGYPGPRAAEGHGPSSRGPLDNPAHGGVPGFTAQGSLTRPPPPPGSPGVMRFVQQTLLRPPVLTGPAVASAGAFLQPRGQLGEEPTHTWGIRAEPASSSNTAARLVSSRSLGAEGRVRGRLLLPRGLQAGLLAWPAVVQPGKPGVGPAQVHSQHHRPGHAGQTRLIPTLQVPVSCGPGTSVGRVLGAGGRGTGEVWAQGSSLGPTAP